MTEELGPTWSEGGLQESASEGPAEPESEAEVAAAAARSEAESSSLSRRTTSYIGAHLGRVSGRLQALESRVAALASAQARELVHLRQRLEQLEARDRRVAESLPWALAALGSLVLALYILHFLCHDVLMW